MGATAEWPRLGLSEGRGGLGLAGDRGGCAGVVRLGRPAGGWASRRPGGCGVWEGVSGPLDYALHAHASIYMCVCVCGIGYSLHPIYIFNEYSLHPINLGHLITWTT